MKHVLRSAFTGLVVVVTLAASAAAQNAAPQPWSRRIADAAIQRWPQGHLTPGKPSKWAYELGTLLDGFDAAWYNTADRRYYQYIQQSVDPFVGADGTISTYDAQAFSLDNVLLGRQLLLLYRVTQKKQYYLAAKTLREQLAHQPKNASGGFWHKQIYPNQMWLDGLYMAEPFFAEYASVFGEPQDRQEITHQFVLIEQHARDPETGLLYHGWDESKQQSWANKQTGDSPNFWGRAMGWYMMALVDTLQYYPQDDPGERNWSPSCSAPQPPSCACRIRRAASGIRCWTNSAQRAITWSPRPRACSRTRWPGECASVICRARTWPTRSAAGAASRRASLRPMPTAP